MQSGCVTSPEKRRASDQRSDKPISTHWVVVQKDGGT